MSKDSQEGLSLWEPLLKVQRHLSVSQQTIHVSQTHSKHTKCTRAHNDHRQQQGHTVHARHVLSGLKLNNIWHFVSKCLIMTLSLLYTIIIPNVYHSGYWHWFCHLVTSSFIYIVLKERPLAAHTYTMYLNKFYQEIDKERTGLSCFFTWILCHWACISFFKYPAILCLSLVSQLVEWVPHVQRLCLRCRLPAFDSICGPLLHVIPPLSTQFLVQSFSCSIKIRAQKLPKKIFKNKSVFIIIYNNLFFLKHFSFS